MTPPPPTLGRYVLVEELDAGGMGSIYVALQRSNLSGVERPCVVKTVQPALLEHQAMRARFLDEAKTSLMLLHKNICTTFDVDDVEGTILLAMERIAGRNLRHVLDKPMSAQGALEPDEVVDIGDELLEGLEHAHGFADPRTGHPLHLVHRDISPKNVMISFSGDVKIIDFGVARGLLNEARTQAGVVVGKLRYLAPEQFVGARVDQRADLVSVGIILTELFSRKRYYGDLSAEAIEKVLASGTPYASAALDAVPRAVRPVLETALARDPEDRFDDAAAFREALRAAWGRPRQSGRLKQMMARLFPGAEAADRAHIQSLFRRAFDSVPPARNVSLGDAAIADDATQRSSPAPGPVHDSDRTLLSPFDSERLDSSPSLTAPMPRAPDPDGLAANLELPPTDELPRPALDAVAFAEPPNTGTVPNQLPPDTSTESGPSVAAPSPARLDPLEGFTVPVQRARGGPRPVAARESATSPLVWLFVGITVAAAVSAVLIVALR